MRRRRHTKYRFQKEFVLKTEHYKEVLAQFTSYVISKGYSESYAKQQVECLREFFCKMEEKKINTIHAIKSDDIRKYHTYLSRRQNRTRGGGLSNSMIEHHLQAIKNCFHFLQQDLILQDNPFTVLRFKKQLRKPRRGLEYEHIQALYGAAKTLRETLLLHIYYACGLRRSEGAALNLNDVHLEQKLLIVREGKLGKRRLIPLQPIVVEDIQAYIQTERPIYNPHINNKVRMKYYTQGTEPLLLSNNGAGLTGNHANCVLKEIVKRLSIKLQKEIGAVYPHLLRHSIATHLINQGMPIETLSEYLGHSSLDSTQVYIYGQRNAIKRQYKQNRNANSNEYKKH